MGHVTFNAIRRLASASAVFTAALLGGCAVYQPPPAVLADGTVTYSSPTTVGPAPAYPAPVYSAPVYSTPYALAPYPVAPYYIGPPVSLGLWFGSGGGYRHHGWGGHYYGRGGFSHGHGGFRGGWGGRHR